MSGADLRGRRATLLGLARTHVALARFLARAGALVTITDLKPAERTRNLYRFEVKVPAGKSGDLEVVEERDLVKVDTRTGQYLTREK